MGEKTNKAYKLSDTKLDRCRCEKAQFPGERILVSAADRKEKNTLATWSRFYEVR
jgi:hypothetical protein